MIMRWSISLGHPSFSPLPWPAAVGVGHFQVATGKPPHKIIHAWCRVGNLYPGGVLVTHLVLIAHPISEHRNRFVVHHSQSSLPQATILIGSGIGVTPFASILKHILYRQKRRSLGTFRHVEFFYIFRDTLSFGWFQSLLQEVEAAQTNRMSRLDALLSLPPVMATDFRLF